MSRVVVFPQSNLEELGGTFLGHPTASLLRVLKPGGRLVIADFKHKKERQGQAARFHAGGSSMQDLAALVSDAGFSQVETEEMQLPRFSALPGAGFVRAYKN